MPDEIIIRHAAISDLDSFRELRLEALKNHPTAFGADYEESAARPNEYWQERLKIDKEHEALFFAEHKEPISRYDRHFPRLIKEKPPRIHHLGSVRETTMAWTSHFRDTGPLLPGLGEGAKFDYCQIGCCNNKPTCHPLLRALRIYHLRQRTKSFIS